MFLCSPLPGEMIQFDEHIFQMGWFNQHLVFYCPFFNDLSLKPTVQLLGQREHHHVQRSSTFTRFVKWCQVALEQD